MKFKSMVAAALAMTFATPVTAATVNLDLSFDGVTATFFGLDDGVTALQSASSMSFDGVLDTYSGVSASTSNRFQFLGGTLAFVDFRSAQRFGDTVPTNLLDFVDCQFEVPSGSNSCTSFETTLGSGPLAFSAGAISVAVTAINPVPLPAGSILMLSVIAGAAALKKRKKNTT